jgi:hypothetical protein
MSAAVTFHEDRFPAAFLKEAALPRKDLRTLHRTWTERL